MSKNGPSVSTETCQKNPAKLQKYFKSNFDPVGYTYCVSSSNMGKMPNFGPMMLFFVNSGLANFFNE